MNSFFLDADFLKAYYKPLLLALMLLIMLLAYQNAFIQDDAYISFRYAENLAQYGELDWNAGDTERVEGYSNFLWTILLFAGLKIGLPLEELSVFIGLACLLGSLLCTYRLARNLLPNRLQALTVLLLLGTNHTFSAYGSGGLETQLQTFLLILQTYLIFQTRTQDKKPAFFLLLSLLAALSLLVRLDSAVYLAVLYAYLLYRLVFRTSLPVQALILRVAYLALPLSLVLGGWFYWKLSYYGELLPNTFYVKTSGLSIAYLKQGLRYLHTFFSSYLLLPLLLLPAFYIKRLLKQEGLTLSLLLCGSWMAYILYVGGDFMEFRFMVPVLPLVFLLMGWSIFQLRYRWLRSLLVLFILGGSLYHAQTFYYEYGIESTNRLHAHIRAEDENWAGVGELLANHFGQAEEPVVISTTAAGAIPYFAGLPTIDMLGLNDPWIARNEKVRSPRPGHQKRASLAYLQRKKVNLLVGQPQVRPKGQFLERPLSSKDMLELGLVAEDSLHIPSSAQVLVFPLDANYEAAIIYLRQSDAVDAVVAKEKLLTYPLLSAPADQKKGTLVQAIE